MPRDLDLTFDISTGALTLDRVVGNYVKRSETLTLSVTIVSNGASATIPSGLVGTLKPVNTYGTTLAQWTTFSQVGATNVYTASTTINAAAVTTLLGTTTEQSNCVFDFAGAGVVESDTLALVLKNNVTRDDDTAPTALLNRNDFLVSNGTGLLVNVAAGYAANGAFVAAQASLAITNATNYIEVTAAGVASVNTTAFTAGSYPLATVVASAGAITTNTDLRAWITPKPAAAGGVTSITGTANEITVTGTTTPTLSLPSALTFTGKTITGGTFASPSLTTPTIGDGTEAAPSLSFTSDTNTGVYRPTADTVGIVGGGHDILRLTDVASATDYLEVKNGIGVGSPLHVLAEGASANIGVHLQPKGSGLFTISDGTDFNKGIRFRSSSSAASAITLLDAVSTAGRVVTLPDATGTLALVSGDLGTPSALVGTNITGTASGLTAGNATLAATVTVANEATDTTCFPLFATAATGSLAALSNAGLTFNSATGLLSATGLAGAFNGTVGATTPSTVAGTTGTFSGAVTGTTFNAVPFNRGLNDAIRNIALGDYALISTTTGSNNIAIGRGALEITTTGDSNLAIGPLSLLLNVSGNTNTAVGYSALGRALGSGNVAIGNEAGAYETGSDSLYIDNQNRTNTAGDKAKALIYGTFAATAATQQLTINAGTITLNGSAVTATSYAGAGSGLTALNASNVSSGTLADARLSANVPLKDAANTFTAAQANSTAGAASLPAMKFSGVPFAGTGTTSFPLVYINDANATASTTLNTAGTYFGVNGDGTQDLMNLLKDGASQFKVTSVGTLFTTTSGGVDIAGAGGINAGAVWANGNILGEGLIGNRNNGGIQIGASGIITLRNLAYSDAVSQLNFGNLSSASYPAWRRDASSTTIKARLSDNSADAPISASNVTASGTLAVTGATTLTGNLTSNGALISTPQALTGAGAVNVTTLTTAVTTTAPAQALTLANGTNGQIKTIVHQALSGGGTWVLTPTTKTGYTTITSTAVGETCTLQFFTTIGWCILSLRGAIAA